jgi:hypothetical protein
METVLIVLLVLFLPGGRGWGAGDTLVGEARVGNDGAHA